jgi:iron(III) transport system permease protein
LVTSLLATAALAATEMTVVNLYGFRTAADEFYVLYAVRPTSTSILMTIAFPCVIGVALCGSLSAVRRQRLSVPRREHQWADRWSAPRRPWTVVSAMTVIAITMLVLLVPVTGLLVKAGHRVTVEAGRVHADWSIAHALRTLAAGPLLFAEEYQWTILLAFSTAAAALLIAWPLAAWGRSNRLVESVSDLGSIVIALLPGPVVGLAVVRLFQTGGPGFELAYQRTLLPTVIALLFRAGPVAYWIIRAGYRTVGSSVIDAARLDLSWWRRLWSVDRRLVGFSLFAAGTASGIVASGDVPATLPVVPPGVTTVGVRLFGLLHSGARQQEAVLALWYVAGIVVFVAAGFIALSRRQDASKPRADSHVRDSPVLE